ncbi:MAG: undecaprenyl/decaprenyl-phosphate alpha-N-acetylglucosaminyl 1-phosphate transferase [Helicobacter sp.]|nr:undecaprenyl/decaprenyl-phosphate alpha-N-acetylglucosaminyl 1-phosphate transferase [Helicobacter sp.]
MNLSLFAPLLIGSSLVICLFCIFYAKRFSIGLDSDNKPQKSHVKDTPRLGGLGIFIAFAIGYFFVPGWNLCVFLGLLLVFFGGILEDILGTLKPALRLFIQMFGLILMLQFDYGVVRDLSPVIFLPFWAGFLFSIFGIVGVCNALNIIDGLNGLASGISLLILVAIFVASKDLEFVRNLSALGLLATIGFMLLNFPRGLIFLGDGGAYFLGALIGFLLGIMSNFGISAWFGFSIMIYPIFEVIFSIIRRKIRGKKAMRPDGLHLHSLLFKLLRNNPLSSSIIVAGYFVYLYLLLSLAKTPFGYILGAIFFCIFYIICYFALVFASKRTI